jgi:hypothetical protein
MACMPVMNLEGTEHRVMCVQFHYSKYLVVVVTNMIQEHGIGIIFYWYFNVKIEQKLATRVFLSQK